MSFGLFFVFLYPKLLKMRKQIKISLHPLFIVISCVYLVIFFTYGIKNLKTLINSGYNQADLVGLIVSILAISLFAYLVLVRYRRIDIYNDRYVLRSLIASRTILFKEVDSIRQVPLNLFHLRLGSVGLMGVISFTSKPEHYNVSDLGNTLRIALKNNEVIHISCDKPDEITNNIA